MNYLPYKIKAKKQENGLWGTPFQCTHIDKIVFLPSKTWKLKSAIMIALSEVFENYKYRVNLSSEDGFSVTLYMGYSYSYNTNTKMFRIRYNDYELEGDTLYYVNKEQLEEKQK